MSDSYPTSTYSDKFSVGASVSILRRLVNLGRAELNSLLDKAATVDDDELFGRDKNPWAGLEDLSDEELVAELERRKREKEAAARGEKVQGEKAGRGARAERGERRERPRADPGAGARARRPSDGVRPAAPRGSVDEVTRAYAALEIPPGSSFEVVRKSYRTLMRKYHPDHHTGSPEKQKAANEVARKLTDAYKLLEKRLRR